MDDKNFEKYTSAITMSDMEIFVFPELMYALVLADIMSPNVWRWRENGTFKKLRSKSVWRRLTRLRQFIMDEYDFNLDLETWGLTGKDRELGRFSPYISQEQIAASNALFGYTGDRYYFDVDIRRQFGLDAYDEGVIPYWKTETVEAMDAFKYKANYEKGAGECVSLAVLYAAAAFIVAGVPLEDIYMLLTPLHSQNFIDIKDGVLSNNRRVVTKSMWFNGTEISDKAQRALRNEQVTIVTHSSGYVHCLYDEATIDKGRYEHFNRRLGSYLRAKLDITSFASFLRSRTQYQKYFQVCKDCHGKPRFAKAETLFSYEHSSNNKLGDTTHEKLLDEVLDEDWQVYSWRNRVRCDHLEEYIQKQKPDMSKQQDRRQLERALGQVIGDKAEELVEDLWDFLHIEPRLPSSDKKYVGGSQIKIGVDDSREQIIEYLENQRESNVVADLAFYAYRDMLRCDWRPFVAAAMERNPVSIEMTKDMDIQGVYDWLGQLQNFSIYEGGRLAQPDEVANFGVGDGLEKAFLLANVILRRKPEQPLKIIVDNNKVVVRDGKDYRFESQKQLSREVELPAEKVMS